MWSELPRAFTLRRLVGKTLFWNWFWTLTEHISATEHDIHNRKETFQSTTPLHTPKFGELWSRNGWERLASFCPPPKFSHWETTARLTAWTLYNRQQANVGTCCVVARAYSLEQQNAGRAYAGLCDASSIDFCYLCPWDYKQFAFICLYCNIIYDENYKTFSW